jgi:hypothetical protein
MQTAFSRTVGGMRFFGRIESSKVYLFLRAFYLGFPTAPFRANAKKTRGVRAQRLNFISRVIAPRAFSYVYEAIIRWVMVYVVNIPYRPTTVNIQPSQTVCFIEPSANTDVGIAIAFNVPRKIADYIVPHAAVSFSRKNSGLWIVMQQFVQMFCGKLGFAHISALHGGELGSDGTGF